jgi:hypothetical protein
MSLDLEVELDEEADLIRDSYWSAIMTTTGQRQSV